MVRSYPGLLGLPARWDSSDRADVPGTGGTDPGQPGQGRQSLPWPDPAYPQLHLDIYVADISASAAGVLVAVSDAVGGGSGGAWRPAYLSRP